MKRLFIGKPLAARGIELILLPSAGTARSQVLADLAVLLGGKPL